MWAAYITRHLDSRLKQLERNIERLRRENQDLRNHPDVRLYVGAVRGMEKARQDPTRPEYLLGNTLGTEHRDWRRIKRLLPSRYRMFFKFFSTDRDVFFVWMNDAETLRKEGAKSDCYAYFRWMLDAGKVPSCRNKLLDKSILKS